jgi:hypothetical protein
MGLLQNFNFATAPFFLHHHIFIL